MIKVGDFVVVSSGSRVETSFNPDTKRKVFFHTPSGQLRIYDDNELNGEVDAEPEIELTQVRILGRLYNLVPVEG